MSHIFQTEKFRGKSLEQVYLTDYAELEGQMEKERRKDSTSAIIQEFDELRQIVLGRKTMASICRIPSCSRPGVKLSLYPAPGRGWVPRPYFWCEEHEPWSKRAGVLAISFDVSKLFKSKVDQRIFCKNLCRELGMERVTKELAHSFFYHGDL
ncbi:MAG: hypothetical protein V3S89_04950 [Desulfobacterales bacterium]